ncbi:MAG: hypothetical protein OXU20_03230 [Myxococcales bacterium]|nr:hypothetical protein [Myxococcales bacterium]
MMGTLAKNKRWDHRLLPIRRALWIAEAWLALGCDAEPAGSSTLAGRTRLDAAIGGSEIVTQDGGQRSGATAQVGEQREEEVDARQEGVDGGPSRRVPPSQERPGGMDASTKNRQRESGVPFDAPTTPARIEEMATSQELEGHYRGCVALASCLPRGLGLGNCIHLRLQTAAPHPPCIHHVRTCDDVLACVGVTRRHDLGICSGVAGWRCDGDLATYCGAPQAIQVDCAHRGASCRLPSKDIGLSPNVHPCVAPEPTSCTDGQVGCAGSPYRCLDGKPYVIDCGIWEARCETTSEGAPVCTHDNSCSELDSQTCEGGAIVMCSPDGLQTRFDCAFVGDRCELNEQGEGGYCLGPGQTIEGFLNCEERCQGSVMSLCGRPDEQLDCQDYGFRACEEYIDTAIGTRTLVRCTQ